MDGILDVRFDHIPVIPQKLSAPLAWVKFTIACFRFSEVMGHFEDEGYDVRPLLVVRDVRSVFNSLVTKSYGRNGITADDPPLRLRLRRFLEDYRLFRDRAWPILKFEDFASAPVAALRGACDRMGLAWDEAMATWPKRADQIADAGFGNETFVLSRGKSLTDTIQPKLATVNTDHVPPEDLEWMELEFAEMNRQMEYPRHVEPSRGDDTLPRRAVPRFENTRRYERLRRKHRISRFLQTVSGAVTGLLPGTRPGAPR